MDCALATIAKRRPVKQVCEVPGVSRSNVTARLARPDDWRDGCTARQTNDAELVGEIRHIIAGLPRGSCRRVWGRLRSERENRGAAPGNVVRVYRIMRVHSLLVQRSPMPPRPQHRHDGKVAVAT